MDIKIKKILDTQKIKYKLTPHRKVYTAFNEAETQHVDPKAVVKTVFVKLTKPSFHLLADGRVSTLEAVLVAVPAGKRVALKKIAKTVNDHQAKSYKLLAKQNPKAKKPAVVGVKLAGEKDILKKLKTKIGLLHPFGGIFGLPVLIDKKLLKNKKLIVSAGSYTESLELAAKDYLKTTPTLAGNFTE